jgi:hypothetical protein
MNSNLLSGIEQGQLMLTRAAPMLDIPPETVLARRSFLAAINLCIEISGLEDKEIYLPLGIDAGHFSNIRKGKGHFPPDKLLELMELCRNEVPLVWLAHQRGYGLTVLKSEAEKRAEAAEARARAAEMKLRAVVEAFGGRLAAA